MSFDRIAPHYRWMEALLAGNKLQACRTAFLNEVGSCRDVLILGEGNGRFLVECRRRLPHARITVVDSSPRMLQNAATRLRRSGLAEGKLVLDCSDARSWAADSSRFNLVVTHFFLDCFTEDELAQVIDRIAVAAAPECHWLLADFRIPASGPKRFRAAAIHKIMYLFFRFTTGISATQVNQPDLRMQLHGFRCCAKRSSEWGLLTSELWVRNNLDVEG